MMHLERITGKTLPIAKTKDDRCSICGKSVGAEEAQTDERGDLVHEPCLVTRSAQKTERFTRLNLKGLSQNRAKL
jgi:hypothetical protein